MTNPIRALIVDDEPLARERIRALLANWPTFVVAGECGNGHEALQSIRRLRPELVFLDVQMPGLDGFEVLDALEPAEWPSVIFVTAYDQYALRAFDVNAIDYLLKPFDRSRFERAVRRAEDELRDRIDETDPDHRITALLDYLYKDRERPRRLIVKTGGRICFVNIADIDWVEAAGNYVKLHVGAVTHMLRDTMKNVEAHLTGVRFARLHRSTMVNLNHVRELQQTADGDWEVVLNDGTRLNAGRDGDTRLRQALIGHTRSESAKEV